MSANPPRCRPRQPATIELKLPISIGVLSDTHLSPRRDALPPGLLDELRAVDVILHAGDFSCVEALEHLRDLKPTWGVAGNTDPPSLAVTLPERLEFRIGARTGLMVHGHNPYGTAASRFVMSTFAGKYDLVIFGHSHMPCSETIDGTLFLNPGSPTQRRRAPHRSWAIVDVGLDETIRARHITL